MVTCTFIKNKNLFAKNDTLVPQCSVMRSHICINCPLVLNFLLPLKAHSHQLCFLLPIAVDSCISAEIENFIFHIDTGPLWNPQTILSSQSELALKQKRQEIFYLYIDTGPLWNPHTAASSLNETESKRPKSHFVQSTLYTQARFN